MRDVLAFGLGHKRILAEPYPGIMHILILWGAIVLVFATAIVALQADFGVYLFHGDLYLFIKATANLFGLLILVGIAMAAWRRYVTKPKRLDNKADDGVTLALLALILITGFLVEGARMAAVPDSWAAWGFVGNWLAAPFAAAFGPSGLLMFHRALWWFHLSLTLGLVAYLPYSKLFHLLLAPANQFMRPRGPIGVPDLIDFEDESVESYGISALSELPRKTLFDTDACLRCGRCQDACPATASGKHLNPKAAIQDLRTFMMETGRAMPGTAEDGRADGKGRTLIGQVILEADLWACTTCRACEAACPVYIGHRGQDASRCAAISSSMESRFPRRPRSPSRASRRTGTPGVGQAPAADWAKELPVETMAETAERGSSILYWVGCARLLEDRAKKVSPRSSS